MSFPYFEWQTEVTLWQQSIEKIAKNLPPAGEHLYLFNASSPETLQVLQNLRPDIQSVEGDLTTIETDTVDAVVGHSSYYLQAEPKIALQEWLRILRPGGRLIIIDPSNEQPPRAALGVVTGHLRTGRILYQWHRTAPRRFSPEMLADELLEAGYVRILSESMMDGWGIMARGEKPHKENTSTLERIARVAQQSGNQSNILRGHDCLRIRGRYVHLLIQQTPNQPAWKVSPDELTWHAATVQSSAGETIILAFTALPKAVAFMQQAVMQGTIRDINKVAKFGKETAATWQHAILLNPELDIIQTGFKTGTWLEIDPATAEAPDE